jgi:RNA polymerase sigma factor (TIGR02999 family)
VPLSSPGEVTRLLAELRAGNREAESKLIALVYNELRRIARYYMKLERTNHTLQPTAVVHEVYLKLVRLRAVNWQNRDHFLAFAARQMRRVLCEYARRHGRVKRGAEHTKVPLDEGLVFSKEKSEEVIDVDRALTRLENYDERQGKTVEMIFFGGLSVEETAAALGVSPTTVKRDWSAAKAWLYRDLHEAKANDTGTEGTRQRTI